MILVIGSLLSGLAIGLSAYFAHGLKMHLDPKTIESLITAARYQLIHGVILAALGLYLLKNTQLKYSGLFRVAGYIFIIGIAMFSGSIYLSAWLAMPKLTYLAPVGGVSLIIAWFVLAGAGFLESKK